MLTFLPRVRGVYLVGGAVRDARMERKPNDFDIAVFGDAESFAEAAARELNCRAVKLGKPQGIIYRLHARGRIYDISPLWGPDIETDLLRRDFTVNAMAWSLEENRRIDPFGGLGHIQERRIRRVTKECFYQDPLRLLRAYRFGAQLGFDMDPETDSAIQDQRGLIRMSAGERIREELLKLLQVPESAPHIRGMEKSGLLFVIFPELLSLKSCGQNRHHDFNALEHTLRAFEKLEALLGEEARHIFDPDADGRSGEKEKIGLLKLAVLLHDIGKSGARSVDEKGIVHFYGHERAGAEEFTKIGHRLKLSRKEMHFVESLIENHLRPLHLFNADQKGMLTGKGVARFFMRCRELTPYLLLHSLADMEGKNRTPQAREIEFRGFIRELAHHYHGEFKPRSESEPLITGRDLIEIFGLSPSPDFKRLLSMVEAARYEGRIETREDALRMVQGALKKSAEE